MNHRYSILKQSQHYPLGLIVITLLGIVSSLYITLRSTDNREGLELWAFNREQQLAVDNFNKQWVGQGGTPVNTTLINMQALERRMLAGFFGGIPTADIIQTVRSAGSQAWRGPIDAVGFLDLTDRLHESGLYNKIVPAAFSAYTTQGRIFGIPQDIHPVLLTYRADIYEAAGIDVSQLETWEAFIQASLPLIADRNENRAADRYILEISDVDPGVVVTLMLQTGVDLFNEDGHPQLTHHQFIHVLSHLANWSSKPNKVAESIDLHSGAGHRLRSDGLALAWVTPDWRSRANELYAPQLAGKVKLMPLPAWQQGGLRTSVWGGTMIGIPKSSRHFNEAWDFIENIYNNRETATSFWTELKLLTPVRAFWDDPIFDQPNEFHSGQPTGRLYIDQADQVPLRTSSVYYHFACTEALSAFSRLIRYAENQKITSAKELEPEATRLLESAQRNVLRQMQRNIFHQAQLPER